MDYFTTLQPHEREAYEQYCLSDTLDGKLAALSKFVEGSQTYNYLYIVTKMREQKCSVGKLPQKDRELFEKISKHNNHTTRAIQAMNDLYEFDEIYQKGKPEEWKKKLDEIRERYFSGVYLSPSKPHFAQNVAVKKVDAAESSDDEASKPESAEAVKNATLPADFFNEKRQLEELYASAKEASEKKKEYRNEEYDHLMVLNRMPTYLIHSIDFGKFNEKAVYQYAQNTLCQANEISGIENKSFLKQIKAGISAYTKDNKYWEVNLQLCKAMTIEQLEQLKSFAQGWTDANVLGSLFSKRFSEQLSQEVIATMTSAQKYQNMIQIYRAAKTDGLPKSLQMQLLGNALMLGPKACVYDVDLFNEYIKWREYKHGGGTTAQKIGQFFAATIYDSHQGKDWSSCVNNLQMDAYSFDYTTYLTHFAFERNGDLSAFKHKSSEYLPIYRVEEVEDRVKIYLAKDGMTGFKDHPRINHQFFKQISDEVNLTFLPDNQEKFKPDELVSLRLDIKNVGTVHARIFEFNTETYYRKNMKTFDTTIDLDGLESTVNKTFDYSNLPSNVMVRKTFDFPELNGKVGLFIVEFVGNGRSARAVVKKGSLSLIFRSTVAGHLLYILDDKKEICKGGDSQDDKTGVFFEKKFYEADKEKGTIFIPYGKSQVADKIIMKHGTFAQMGEFTRKTEEYSFDCTFFLNGEQILVGNSAQIIIKPQLLINGRQASLAQLKNSTASISTVNYIDNIPITKNFDNLKLEDGRELVIDFQVPPNLESIKVSFQTQVLNNISKAMQNFSSSHSFQVATHKGDGTTWDFHLRVTEGRKYEVHCLGKNGEPRPQTMVNVELVHSRLGTKHCSLTSDRHGKIYLGKLDHVLSIGCGSDQTSRSWNIYEMNSDTWSYPGEINVIEGSTVEIPVADMWDLEKPNQISRNQFSLYRTLEGEVVEDCFAQIQIVPKAHPTVSHYNLMKVPNLKHGTYTWSIRGDINVSIQIVVHKGTLWNNLPNFILQRNCIREIVQSQKIVKIQETDISENKSVLRIKLADFSQDARVHIIASKFIQPSNSGLFNNIARMSMSQLSCSVYHFAMWSNFYLSDRILSDEFRYVFDRAHAPRQLGNTLDRPQLVNKRLFTRKTEMDQEVLNQGTNFAFQEEVQMQMAQPRMMQQMAQPMMRQMAAPRAMDMMMCQNAMPMAEESFGFQKRSLKSSQAYYGGGGSSYMVPRPKNLESFWASELQNFMKIQPLQVFNIKPNANGDIIYRNDKLQHYSNLLIVVADKESVVQHFTSLEQPSGAACPSRDLTLKNALDESKGLIETRQSQCLFKDQSDFIEDIASSEIKLIDDLQKVNEILHEIQKYNGKHCSTWGKLAFVNNWANLTKQQKDNHLSEYGCHELHFFIKKRDVEYFDAVVRPVIQSKLEKSLVDYYLIDDFSSVVAFQDRKLDAFNQLNAFEKCLFVDSLVCLAQMKKDSSLRDQALAYAKLMREMQNAVEKQNRNQRVKNYIFDLVLNLNSLDRNQQNLIATSTTSAAIDNHFGSGGPGGLGGFGQANFGGNQFQQQQFMPSSAPISVTSSNSVAFGAMNMQQNLFSNAMYLPPQQQMMNQAMFRQMEAPQRMNRRMDRREQRMEMEMDMDMACEEAEQCYDEMDMIQDRFNDFNYNNNYDEDPFSNQYVGSLIQQHTQQAFAHEAFSQLEKTSEYAETFYYNTKISHHLGQSKSLVDQSLFWCDYADFLANQTEKEFLTTNFTECKTPIDSFFAGCVLALPSRLPAPMHKRQPDESRGLTITAGSNLIIFKKEIKNVEINLEQDFMVTHRYAREDGNGNSNEEEAVPTEFLINTPYSCEVIMTNVSPYVKEFNLLYQIPVGSLPIYKTKYMMSKPFKLQAYTTERTKFFFYFPTAGVKSHYPSNVSIDDKVTARGEFNILNSVKRRKITEAKNFSDLIQIGTPDEILKFIEVENWLMPSKGFSLSKVLHLCTDVKFWTRLIKILRGKNYYSSEVWQFGFLHTTTDETLQVLQEYIANNGQSLTMYIEPYFQSILFNKSDPKHRNFFSKMLEYDPMINARAHKIGQQGERKILNRTLRTTYDNFLQTIACKRRISYEDKLILLYYLQLQDRIQEAVTLFMSLDSPDEAMSQRGEYQLEAADKPILEIQYDYMRAYFDFFIDSEGRYNVARKIVQRYDNYPISSWRLKFLAIQDQLDEFDGEFDDGGLNEEADEKEAVSDGTGSDATLRIQERKQENLKKSKKREPNISNIDIDENGNLKIETVNIPNVTVKYYIIDAEVMFSRAPFLQNNAEQFSYVTPYLTIEKSILQEGASEQEQQAYITTEVLLPEQLQHMNLVIELNGADKQQFKTFYGNALKVVILESYGELKVTHKESGVALPKVYVKVFSQNTGGKTEFYRDGYTDIRGKFEYAQASGESLSNVTKFAILVSSGEYGAQIREIQPPKTESGKTEMQRYAKIEGGGFQVQGYSEMQNLKANRMWARNQEVKKRK